MRQLGAIVREPLGIPHDEWLATMSRDPALRPMEPHKGINPFTRQPMEYGRPYAAYVTTNHVVLGTMVWEANHIIVAGQLDAISPIAFRIATKLGGRFILEAEFPAQLDDRPEGV